MQNTRRKTLAAFALALALLPALALAHERGRGHGGHGFLGRHLAAELDLTVEQRTQIRDLLAAHEEQLAGQAEAAKQARGTLFGAVHGDVFDEGAIREAAAGVARAEEELAVTRALIFQEVRQVLTPEQQAAATDLLATARARFKEMADHLKGRWLDGCC